MSYEIKGIRPQTFVDDMGSLIQGYRVQVHSLTGLDFFVDVPPNQLDKQAVHQRIVEELDKLEGIWSLTETQGMEPTS